MIKILLVDDNHKFLQAAKGFLALEPEFEVIGEACTGHDALKQISHLGPDLVLLDLVLPDINGFEITRQIKLTTPSPKVIILTLHDQPQYRDLAQFVEADGFVSKADFGTDLVPLVNKMLNDSGQEQYFGAYPGADK